MVSDLLVLRDFKYGMCLSRFEAIRKTCSETPCFLAVSSFSRPAGATRLGTNMTRRIVRPLLIAHWSQISLFIYFIQFSSSSGEFKAIWALRAAGLWRSVAVASDGGFVLHLEFKMMQYGKVHCEA